jgi:hydroxyacid-oxoacid transhydrogenase
MELSDRGARHVLVVTDPTVAKLEPVSVALQALDDEKVAYSLFDHVRSEPTDGSMKDAIEFANAHPCEAFVAIGGGSVIDTAKAANLYSTCPADFLDYVNAPVGKAPRRQGTARPKASQTPDRSAHYGRYRQRGHRRGGRRH